MKKLLMVALIVALAGCEGEPVRQPSPQPLPVEDGKPQPDPVCAPGFSCDKL